MENVAKPISWRVEIAMCGIALAMLAASGFYTMMATHAVKTFQSVASAKKVAAFNAKTYEDLAERLQSPLPWMFHEHKLFVSRILVYLPKEKMIQPLDLSKTGSDMIPYAWKREHGFSVEDPNVATADFDGDGFSNFEEFQMGTDPRDCASSPPPILKLRMEKYQATPFQFIFKGYTTNPDGSHDYQINLNSPRGLQTFFVKKGQRLNFDGEAWMIGEFRRKVEKRMNPTTQLEQEFDESELDLKRAGFNENKKTLVKGQEMDASERKVLFVSLIPLEPMLPPVAKDGVFVFREEEYLVIAADETGVTVKRLTDGKEFRVPTITKEEKAAMVLRDEKGKK